MKKTLMLVLSVALCASCAAKRSVQQPVRQPAQQTPIVQESETQRQIRELKEQQELKRLQREMELEELRAQKEKNELQTQIGLQESMMDGDQKIVKFCYEESLDKPGEYMAGIGVSSPKKYLRVRRQ